MARTPQLSLEEEDFVEKKVLRLGTTKTISYLFWIFFGGLGVHRFYNGAIKTGITMAAMHILGFTFLIFASLSIVSSGMNFSTFSEYMECIEDNPYDHEEVCAPYYEKKFEQQFAENWGENGPEIPVATLTIGSILLGCAVLWWFIDIFLIPGLVRKKNREIRKKYIQQVLKLRRQREQSYDDYPEEDYSS